MGLGIQLKKSLLAQEFSELDLVDCVVQLELFPLVFDGGRWSIHARREE